MTTRKGHDDEEGGLSQAADSLVENLGNKVPDGVDGGPTDNADQPADPRTRTHSSISEGLNANSDDEPPAVLDDGHDGGGSRTSS